MLLKFENCKCVGCRTDLTKQICQRISFNWKTIECPRCKRTNAITVPAVAYNSFFHGLPVGALCGYVWYVDSFNITIKALALFISFLLFTAIYIIFLVKKITLS